ncbi:DUF4179 domain-containing protein [Brevibacillus laterosporus]|uniref:DUF4179 domain-containing protein n=1 Tax=Brevibacillus laterosporus TaxID=1465 RepID=UPI00215C48D3|nr:DUF4179 domain-containing protein [Brevibacillus laterosporus]MCR8995959.1 DUF4179 domain-containing protein [Brevibacillus laterosporus]
MKNQLNDLKKSYESIEIPNELDAVIQSAKAKGNAELSSRDRGVRQMKKKTSRMLMKGLSGVAALFIMFGVAVNTSPSFVAATSDVPFLGSLVKVLQFNNGYADGGERTDGVSIKPITLTQEKDDSEQIVINFTQGNEELGEETQQVAPDFNVIYQENPYTMTFTVNGVRWVDEKTFEKLKNSELVADAYRLITLDDSSDRFVIVFKSPVKYEVKEYSDPARIVLNLSKDNQYQEKTVYSIRSAAYPLDEHLAIIGDRLERELEEKGVRFLKDGENRFYIEIGQLENMEEANQKAAQITEKYSPIFNKKYGKYGMDFKVFVEKRGK